MSPSKGPQTFRNNVRSTATGRFSSNKRRKSRSLSSTTRSMSPVLRAPKRQKTFVLSEDEVKSTTPEADDMSLYSSQESPDSDFPSTSATRVVSAETDDEVSDKDAAVGSDDGVPVYKVLNDELAEDDNLQIIGETDPADLSDSESEDDDSRDLPVRLISDFTIYDMETFALVPVAELLQIQFGGSAVYGASGVVKSFVDNDDDGDENDVIDEEDVESELLEGQDDDQQLVKLSKVLEFNIHHASKRKKLDSNMYLRTQFAWYILDSPSSLYSSFFTPFWTQHRILHLVVTSSLDNRRITFDQFISSLQVTPLTSDSIAISMKMLGRELNKEDVESDEVKSYILVTLEELREQNNIKINRVPLVRSLCGEEGIYAEDEVYARSTSRSPRKKPKQEAASNNPEQEVLKHRNPTVVTPLVADIAKMLFERTLSVAGQLEKDDEEVPLAKEVFIESAHHGDPDYIEWLESDEVAGYYKSVEMDGVTYSIGDTVMVVPGQDVDNKRVQNAIAETSQTSNTLGNTMWFCRICYMYEKKNQKLFHGQWYTHGSKTLLQETAHPQSLFLIDDCESGLPLASIYQKCNLRELAIGDDEPVDESAANENNFFHGLTWMQDDCSLVQLTQVDIDDALSQCEDGKTCLSCGLKRKEASQLEFRPLPHRGFFQRGIKYHIDEFVYIVPSKNSASMLYEIGQITKVRAMENPPQVTVRMFGRYDIVIREMRRRGQLFVPLASDERCLFKTSKIVNVDADRVDGKCFVAHLLVPAEIDQWVKTDDHYFVNQWAESTSIKSTDDLQELGVSELQLCQPCHKTRVEQLSYAERLLEKNGPLRGLELYSGAGGLGSGFDMSGFVDTRWAVEFSPSAALTYQANHPETVVFNQCSNMLLQHAIDTHDGKLRDPLRSLRDRKVALPAMPKPGEVDFVYGGPPCQSFSGANHWKKADDVRSTLVCNMLSYVEFYRPSYFLLENVLGLLQYPLRGRMVGRTVVGGVKMGVVKFIVRSLTCLGYQVRFKVLQAGQYGAPQGRRRVLFWGAKRGLPLPEFPIPTHAFTQRTTYINLPTGERLAPPTRSKDSENQHQLAPLLSVTINDATGDLPPFDWINPHVICKPTSTDVKEAKSRSRDLGIPCLNALSVPRGQMTFPGFTEPEAYSHRPLNRYQRRMRQHVVGNKIKYQYTRRFPASVVERVVNIPLLPDAYHNDLPARLRMNPATRDGDVRKFDGLYGRMDGNGYFKTAMTTVAPNAKGGTLLHPWQKRIVTIQECARAQGFPDHYQFLSVNKQATKVVQDQHRQIGNAVPVPLAFALGKSLGEALLKTWQEEDRAGSPEV